ncbi:MAG: ABC transporter ATP-binding protein [Syntrophomonadaceae bacterium]|nr:ABC transporter ATP-binding protein [Syntrophomonadaceae bacterium]
MNNSLVKRSLSQVIKKNRGLVALLIIAVLGVVIISLIPPQILKIIIDDNLVPKDRQGLLYWAILYLSVLLFIGVFDFFKQAILTILGQKVTTEIRAEMMFKLGKINSRFFSTHDTGAVVSRFTNDVDAINTLFTSGVVGMIVSSLKIIGIVISIWLFSYKLGLITLLILPVIYAITRLFQKRMLQAQMQNRIQIGQVNNHIAETLNNMLMIKTNSKEKYMEQNYSRYLLDNFLTLDKVNFYDAVFSPIILTLRAVVIAGIVILSSEQLNFLGISLGMIAASIELISILFEPVENLGMQLQNIQQAISGVRRVNEFYIETEEDRKNDELTAAEIIPDRSAVRVNFNNVSFQYKTGTDILQNINLSLKPMEKVTFIGRTGVGKSTLFKLIIGLLQPAEGIITINGIDVCTIPNREKRKIFGYVDQGFHLIKGTAAEQISLQDEGITRREIEEALRYVGMMEYVESLEKGLDTEINSDSLFSQGQKQLLAIARAIVTNPPILLLDEITANLDSITEERIVAVLKKASSAHTVLSISHRLSSVIASDIVVILENGKVKNAGSPEMLLLNDDWYRSHVALEKLTWN